MIIIQLAGGLGNQLQQYALYQKFLSRGCEARLDLSWFEQFGKSNINDKGTVTRRQCELDLFAQLSYESCTEEEKTALIGTPGFTGKLRRKLFPQTVHWYKEFQMYDPELLNYRNMYLSGYFACEKYYADILPELRHLIQFPEIKDEQMKTANQEMLQKIKECNAVSVHIRRGDYLQPGNAAMFGNICTEEYYESALNYMRENIENPKFFLFSDDTSYVKEHYQGKEYIIVDINHGNDSFYDMYLMSQCRGNICANSTFSFWGARLNKRAEKIIIRPTRQKSSQAFNEQQMKEWWRGWCFIDSEGKRYL